MQGDPTVVKGCSALRLGLISGIRVLEGVVRSHIAQISRLISDLSSRSRVLGIASRT